MGGMDGLEVDYGSSSVSLFSSLTCRQAQPTFEMGSVGVYSLGQRQGKVYATVGADSSASAHLVVHDIHPKSQKSQTSDRSWRRVVGSPVPTGAVRAGKDGSPRHCLVPM